MWKFFAAYSTFKGLLSFMNWSNMNLQKMIFFKSNSTYAAFKRHLFLMDRCNVFVQILLQCKLTLTQITCKRLFLIMDWSNMPFQMSFLWKFCITYITNMLFPIMNWFYCPRFLTFPKLSVISHAQLWLFCFSKLVCLFTLFFPLIGPGQRLK